ncbi:hypothetical protein Tco_0739683, partial [Tanacetum coccineum]
MHQHLLTSQESRKKAEVVIGSLKEHVVDPYLAMVQEASIATPLKSKIAHILPPTNTVKKRALPLGEKLKSSLLANSKIISYEVYASWNDAAAR